MKDELLIKCSNAMVNYLTPEELEQYSEAEQSIADAEKAKAELIANAKARNVSGWQDEVSAEEEELLNKLPSDLREAARILEPEELGQYSALLRQEGEANLTIVEFMEIAEKRIEE
jgi:hypothetical protein